MATSLLRNPMGSLFEQSLLIFVARLMERKVIDRHLVERHANLE